MALGSKRENQNEVFRSKRDVTLVILEKTCLYIIGICRSKSEICWS